MSFLTAIIRIFRKAPAEHDRDTRVIPYKDFLSIYKSQIMSLPYKRQIDLAMVVCQKLIGAYYVFNRQYHWGNPDILLDAITLLKMSGTLPTSEPKIKAMITQVESVTPDMDDFGDETSSYALDACVAILETLQFRLDKDVGHIFNVGICYTDTVDSQIQEAQDLTEDEIDKHPLMIEARHFLIRYSSR